MLSNNNWGRSYVIHIGTTERSAEGDNFSASSVVEVGEVEKGVGTIIDGGAVSLPSNARRLSNLPQHGGSVRGFTFSFETNRSLSKSSNTDTEKSMLMLYNIDEDLVSVINQKGCVIRIFVGYGGEVKLAYAGDVMEVSPRTEGDDRVYRIKCIDGGATATDVIGTVDYDESVSVAAMIRDLGSRFPDAAVAEGGLFWLEDKYVTGGETFVGSLSSSFDSMLRRNNLSSVRFNGKIVLVPYRLIEGTKDFEYMAKKNFILTSDLIKDLAPASKNGDKTSSDTKIKATITVITNFTPIEVGQFFTIPREASSKHQGTYLVTKIKTKLESHGQAWDVAITGEIIS